MNWKNNCAAQAKNDIYTQMMPYQEGYDYIEEWMKKYYELPDDMVFEWD